MLNEKEQKIVDIIRIGGPILPIKISKSLGVETYLAGAMLSSLVQNGHLKISRKKIGSSPLYYVPGQENKVREILFKGLDDLEKKTLDRIKELKVAFEQELYPQERFLLKELIDFVTHLKITINNQEISIWKHYSISDEELNKIVQEKIKEPKEKVEEEKKEMPTEEIKEIPETKEEQKKLEETTPKEIENEIEKPKKIPTKRKPKQPSEFENNAKYYLRDKEIEILKETSIKKGETILDVIVHTTLGNQEFLVKIRDKKLIGGSELSRFYLECINAKKPGLLIIPQELSKKSKEFVNKHVGKLMRILVIK